MQDYIIETLRKLLKERDPELIKILLNADRDSSTPVRIRRHIPPKPISQQSDPLLKMVIPLPTVDEDLITKGNAISVLDSMLEKLEGKGEEAKKPVDKGEMLEKLKDLYGWQGVARMFYLLLERAGKDVLTNDTEIWNMSARRPQYKIIIKENSEYGSGVIGSYRVFFSDGENEDEEIRFISSKHKIIYVWFLLHPRQLMTINQIVSGVEHQPDSMKSVNQLLYKKEYKLSCNDNYTQIVSHIGRAVKTAWENKGARGSLDWYTIQGGEKGKQVETKDNDAKQKPDYIRYYLNLPKGSVKIDYSQRNKRMSGAQRLEDCCKEKEYESIDNYVKKE